MYTKLQKYRDEQLENYDGPPVEYSNSDYHHQRAIPLANETTARRNSLALARGTQASRYSLRRNGQNHLGNRADRSVDRQASVAETEKTQSSYDPFRSSRGNLPRAPPDHARITVLRQVSNASHKNISRRPSSTESLMSPLAAHSQENVDVYSIASSPSDLRLHSSRQLQIGLTDRRFSRGNSRVTLSSIRSRGTSYSGIVVRRPANYKRSIHFDHKRRSTSGHQLRLRNQASKRQSQTLKERYFNESSRSEARAASSPPVAHPARSPSAEFAPPRSRKGPRRSPQNAVASTSRPEKNNWNDDVRKISTELDKLCDTAFNRASLSSSTPTAFTSITNNRESSNNFQSPATSFSIYEDPVPDIDGPRPSKRGRNETFDVELQRSTSPLPAALLDREHLVSYTHRELEKTRELLKKRNRASYMEPGYLDDVIAHLDRLMQPSAIRLIDDQRRAVSTPEPHQGIPRKDTFDTILERGDMGFRSTSEPTSKRKISPEKNSIRVVHGSSDGFKAISPIKPLTIRKKSDSRSTACALPEKVPSLDHALTYLPESDVKLGQTEAVSRLEKPLAPIVEGDDFDPTDRSFGNAAKLIPKKRGWLHRNHRMAQKGSRDTEIGPPHASTKITRPFSDCQNVGQSEITGVVGSIEHTRPSAPLSRRGKFFRNILVMGKGHKGPERSTLSGGDYELDDHESVSTEASKNSIQNYHHKDAVANNTMQSVGIQYRNEKLIHAKDLPQQKGKKSALEKARSSTQNNQHQNWLARFLGIKPAMHVLVFQLSRVRARREVISVFRQWRQHGMRDITVDKGTNTIWARVDATNCKFNRFRLSHSLC